MNDELELKRAYQRGYAAGSRREQPGPPLQPLLDKIYIALLTAGHPPGVAADMAKLAMRHRPHL